jgi:signal transduction histidine kinase/CheY-like chemotaxis protein
VLHPDGVAAVEFKVLCGSQKADNDHHNETRRHTVKIRAHLTLIAIATLLPVVVFSGIAISRLLESERQSALKSLQETARLTALTVDRELQSAQAALLVLGTSKNIAAKSRRAFYYEAEAADRGVGAWTILWDQDGRQLANTVMPFGFPLPQADMSGHVVEVLRRKTTTMSGVFKSPINSGYITAVSIPVVPEEGGRYVLSEAFDSYYFTRVFAQSRIPPAWTVAVIDGNGRFIARNRQNDPMIGKPAASNLVNAAQSQAEGQLRHQKVDGQEAYQVFTHSGFSGWTIAVSAPADAIEGMARQAVLFSSLGLAIALLGAAATAVLIGQRLARSIQDAGVAAAALGRGELPRQDATGVEEIDRLNAVLASVGDTLMHERASRRHAEAERERLLLNEQVARKNAEDQNAAKDRFIAMLGHELRNPLSAISGAISLMKADGVRPELVSRAYAIIDRQSSHLSRIVDDLLDLSRLSMGKIALVPQPLELCAVTRACVEALPATRPHAPVRLHIDTAPIWVEADRTRLDQIVANLLGNALKFTPVNGIIDVFVKAEQQTAILTIRDSGIGISRELMPFIFDAFVQGTAQADRSMGGLGIGLNLVRQLVELHGGSVHVVSEGMGKGTTVSVHLPLIDAIDTPSQEQGGTILAEPLEKPVVLLIEDNDDSREMMASLLRLRGFGVLEAVNGADGIRMARQGQPDIAIVDIGLPDMDGYEVARQLHNSRATQAIRLVALTGYGQENDRQRALLAGFETHLVKPVTTEILLSTIQHIAGLASSATGP